MLEGVRIYNEERRLRKGTPEQERNEQEDCGVMDGRLLEQQNETGPIEAATEPVKREIEEDVVGSEEEEGKDHVEETFVVQQQSKINIKKGFVSENVVNLSDRVLTASEIKVLLKGLNFCPTPKENNRLELIRDFF